MAPPWAQRSKPVQSNYPAFQQDRNPDSQQTSPKNVVFEPTMSSNIKRKTSIPSEVVVQTGVRAGQPPQNFQPVPENRGQPYQAYQPNQQFYQQQPPQQHLNQQQQPYQPSQQFYQQQPQQRQNQQQPPYQPSQQHYQQQPQQLQNQQQQQQQPYQNQFQPQQPYQPVQSHQQQPYQNQFQPQQPYQQTPVANGTPFQPPQQMSQPPAIAPKGNQPYQPPQQQQGHHYGPRAGDVNYQQRPPNFPFLQIAGANTPQPEPPRLSPKKKRWTIDKLRATDAIIPLQSGTNQFCSQRGMTGFGTPRDVNGKHPHRLWEEEYPEYVTDYYNTQ